MSRIFRMYLYNNIFNVILWKHLDKFEMNVFTMEYFKYIFKTIESQNLFVP